MQHGKAKCDCHNDADGLMLYLALTCSNGMVRAASASPCLPSCDNSDADKECDKPYREVCVCPAGQLLFRGRCVSICGCTDDDGVTYDVSPHHWSSSTVAAASTCK